MFVDEKYIVDIRRQLHMYPELGFDLPVTLALVKRELENAGIPYTEKYGKSAIVGYINPDKTDFTIGVRADMDALAITERTDVPYVSKIDGCMHACGHDAHTAMLLGAAKALKKMEKDINCRVILVFQPSEEGKTSGAELIVKDGLMDQIDVMIAQHVDNTLPAGTIGACKKQSMAASRIFKVEFFGKSAHATKPETGRDAIAAAVRFYNEAYLALAREVSPFEQYVFSVGKFEGGSAQNIIADYASMLISFRSYDMTFDDFVVKKLQTLAESIFNISGVKVKIDTVLKSRVLFNNPYLCDLLCAAGEKVVGKDRIVKVPRKMSSEDFAVYLAEKPGVFFRIGTRDTSRENYPQAHNSDFEIVEDALKYGSETIVRFILDNMEGIDKSKIEKSAAE